MSIFFQLLPSLLFIYMYHLFSKNRDEQNKKIERLNLEIFNLRREFLGHTHQWVENQEDVIEDPEVVVAEDLN